MLQVQIFVKLWNVHTVASYIVSNKKQDIELLSIPLQNIDQFSKFLQRYTQQEVMSCFFGLTVYITSNYIQQGYVFVSVVWFVCQQDYSGKVQMNFNAFFIFLER